jgi:hypothetical protein
MTVDMQARKTWASRVIPTDPANIFAVLADASLHNVVDGSNMVSGNGGRNQPLALGTRFGMRMHLGPVPYFIRNEVVEFDQDRLIAWRHFGRHVWRWETVAVEGGTLVTETFDWSGALSPKFIELVGYPQRHEANIERSLDRLEAYVSHRADSL